MYINILADFDPCSHRRALVYLAKMYYNFEVRASVLSHVHVRVC